MAWETSLDRLLIREIHQAERGETRGEEVGRQIADLVALAPDRAETGFHVGYAHSLLGLDLQAPDTPPSGWHRFHQFGRLRAHERRGERSWVADLLNDQAAVLDLLAEPRIALQALPLVVRSLFWSGDLTQAVQAIDYLAAAAQDDATKSVVEAALADLLTRLNNREAEPDGDPTLDILQRCVALPYFDGLPDTVRAGYLQSLAAQHLAISDFEPAAEHYATAFELATDVHCLRSRCAVGAALACLRVHDLTELRPDAERAGRDVALDWLQRVSDDGAQVPEALFALGLFAYESEDHSLAAARFDACVQRFRRQSGRDLEISARNDFYLAASLLVLDDSAQTSRALRLMESGLQRMRPDLESFYAVHEALKRRDRQLALAFLDAVDIGRGSAPDQLLLVALEYLALGEAEPARNAAQRVLEIATDLDQRVEAMQVLLTGHNMTGDTASARQVFEEMRDLLLRRGAFDSLEKLLLSEDSVGQALDHLDVKCELVDLYEEMDEREYEKANLQGQIARNLRARKDVDSLREARGLLREIGVTFPDLAREDLEQVEGLLALAAESEDGPSAGAESDGAASCARFLTALGRAPQVLVVGGNERQRRHHPRFVDLAGQWGFDGDWLMANYSSPQKLVGEINDRLVAGKVDLLLLLHWNRHETTEPALEAARKAGVSARTVHYAGFTSLQVALGDQLERLARDAQPELVAVGATSGSAAKGGGRKRQSKK